MAGPWRHPHSSIFYFRRDTPSDLKRKRKELVALGVPYTASIHRSLETRDRKEAERRYAGVRDQVDAMWSRWRALLAGAPAPLSHTEMAGIVGETVRRFLNAHRDQPDATPPFPPISHPAPGQFGQHTEAALKAMPEAARSTYLTFLWHYAQAPGDERKAMTSRILAEYAEDGRHSFLIKDIAPAFADALRVQTGDEAASVFDSLPAPVTLKDEAQAHLMTVGELGAARSALAAASELDYRQLRDLEAKLEALPPFDPHIVGGKRARGPNSSVTFASIIDEEDKRSRDKSSLMAARRGKAQATLKKYRRIAEEFATYRKSGDATTVTKAEVSKWMDHLFGGKRNTSRTTVRDKASALQAITKWGQRQHNGQLYPRGLPLEGLTLPEKDEVDSSKRTYSLEHAQAILLATRKEASRPERRWVPWLMAYSGMRVGEVAQLEKEDLEQIEGRWFVHVVDDGESRTTKTKKGRKVPLHSAVVVEGFVDFVKGAHGPRLFPNRTQANLSEWIRGEVLKGHPNLPPANHGFRHLFRDLCRRYRVDHEAEHHITGRAYGKDQTALAQSSANAYGGSDLRLRGYAEELEKIEPVLTTEESAHE
jgi:integrase